MKKRIKKIISYFFPKGILKEQIKFWYYSIDKPKNTSFSIKRNKNNKIVYKTTFNSISFLTNEALYQVVPDFNYYQHFYKVKNNDIVLDAGANCGHLTLLFSKLVENNGFVYAFEPDVYNIKKIENNIELNKDFLKNIKIEDLLLWNENRLVDFYESGTVGSSAIWMPDKEKCVKKQTIKIDDWVKNNHIKKLDFIKMDIEGAEIEAMEGCIQTIKDLTPNFAIASYHFVNGEQTFFKIEEFFKSVKYPYKTVQFNKTEIITFAGPNILK